MPYVINKAESNHNHCDNHHDDPNAIDTSMNKNIIHDIVIPRIVRCLVPFLTVLLTRGITPGMRQMNLQFTATSSTATAIGKDAPKTSGGRSIQNKLLFYGILQYVIPELLYPLLRYCVQTLLNNRYHQIQKNSTSSTCSTSKQHDSCPNRNMNSNHVESSHQPSTATVSVIRQYRLLQLLQNILDGIDTKVIPIIQFLTLLLCWSGTSTATITNSVPMILSGLIYTSLPPPSSSSSSSSSSSVASSQPHPFLFYTAMAHRRWFTHHIWETIRTIVLPSVAAASIIRPLVFLGSSQHRAISLVSIQRIQRGLTRFRTLVQRFVPSMMVPPPPPPTIQQTRALSDKDPSRNAYINTCPFCQQITPTIAVQAYCPTCDRPQQIYCYACFYQHYFTDRNHSLYDDDDDFDDDDQEQAHCDSVSPTTKSQYESTTSANSIVRITTQTHHMSLRRFYQIPIRMQRRNVRSVLPFCVQCHASIDTVTFVHQK